VDERTIDLTDGKGKHRAEDTLPGGFIPSHLAAPMLRGSAATSLEYAATELGGIRLAADVLADPHGGLPGGDLAAAREIAETATRLQRLLRALAAGALAALVLTVGLAAGPSQRAEAAEAPQPDPVAVRTVPVVLSSAYVTARIPVTTRNLTPRGLHCSSVWSTTQLPAYLGRACSLSASFTVPVTVDARQLPLGRSTVRYTDDVAPMDSPVGTVTLVARRPTAFGLGMWADLGSGQVFVSAPVRMYSPAAGRWLPQNLAPVYVQELTARGWVRVATLTTNRLGVAAGVVTTGGGVFRMRVARPVGSTVTAATGTTRTVVVTTEPLDIV
jgi:hypothetical protein